MPITFDTIDFDEFHLIDLPKRIEAGSGALAAHDLAGVDTLGFKTPDGAAFTYVPSPDTVEIWSGDAAADTVVHMSREDFSDYANELRTCFGLLYAGKAEVSRGDFGWWERWEPALRALYHDRPIIDPSSLGLGDDLTRSFTLDASDAELRDRLESHGFLHIQDVFTADEVASFSAEVDTAKAAARPDDGASWWATQADGSEVCCRVIYLGRQSSLINGLGDDPRLRRIAAIGGSGLEPENDCLDGVSVVIKNPDVTAGLSDLPWHRDCGLGGHSVLCPSVAVGIQLDRASAEAGQLHFVAGSHRGSSHPLKPGEEQTQPVAAIDAEPGDVTVHFGHVLHVAPPPTGEGPFRRAMYVTYTRPETMEFIGEGKGYNDVLFEHDGQVHSVEELTVST
ncbi:MAG: phytanoyl-CoA dioxygenase family protein [Actinobacteria bacterium]|nr:phytanoyl-CoA dioxygenase family protein [Actinomycetota bacterium]